MENKIICKDFNLYIGKSEVKYDDGSKYFDTCHYPDEYEINTTLTAISTTTWEEVNYLINEFNFSGTFISVAELTSFIINLIVNQTTFEEFKTLILESFEDSIRVCEKIK